MSRGTGGTRFDLRSGVRSEVPFRHVFFPPGSWVPAETAAELAATFPEHLIPAARSRAASGTGGPAADKTYHVAHLNVHRDGRWGVDPGTLGAAWRTLLRHLAGAGYAAEALSVLDLPDQPVDLEIRLTSYPSGGWMSRHTDRPDKLFSHNLYLCPGWRPESGGGLALYAGETARDPARVVHPGCGNSVLFARSDHSWHEVMAVDAEAPMPRRAVLVHGYVSASGRS